MTYLTGSFTNPTVVQIPSQIQYPNDQFNRVQWGEDIPFEFPDPGFNCDLTLVITETQSAEPLITMDQTRSTPTNPIVFTVAGGDAKRVLPPGFYFFSLVKKGIVSPISQNQILHTGSFHVIEQPGSLVIDETPAP